MRSITFAIAATALASGCGRSSFDDREVSRCAPNCYSDPFAPGILETDGNATALSIAVTSDATVIGMASITGATAPAPAAVYVDAVTVSETAAVPGMLIAAFDDQSTTWQHLYDATGATIEVRYAAADGDHVLSCGQMTGTIQMQSQSVVASTVPQQPLIAEHDSSGTLLRTHLLPASLGNGQCHGIAASSSSLAIGGIFTGTLDPGGGNLSAQADPNGYAAVYDKATFALRYQHGFIDTGMLLTRSAAITDNDEAYFGGYFEGASDFGGGSVQSSGASDGFVVGYSAGGALQSTAMLAGEGNDVVTRIAVQPDGTALAFCGHTTSTTLSAAGIPLTSSGGDQPVFGVMDASGVATWARVITAGTGQCSGVVVDASGTTHVAGFIMDGADFGAGVETHAGMHGFVAAYDATGALQWSRVWDDGTSVMNITADASGRIWMFGSFGPAVTLDGTQYTATHDVAMFVARARPE